MLRILERIRNHRLWESACGTFASFSCGQVNIGLFEHSPTGAEVADTKAFQSWISSAPNCPMVQYSVIDRLWILSLSIPATRSSNVYKVEEMEGICIRSGKLPKLSSIVHPPNDRIPTAPRLARPCDSPPRTQLPIWHRARESLWRPPL